MRVSFQDGGLAHGEAKGVRARTRKLMLETAISLMQQGDTPSVSDVAEAAGTPQQMRYEQEELVTGTVLFHRWGFDLPPTADELAGLGAGILRWAERPHIGGRNAVGHGNILPRYQGLTPETRLLTDGSAPLDVLRDRTVDEALRDHVAAHLDAITDLLRSL